MSENELVDGGQPRPRTWLGIIGVTIALSAPVVQILLIPFFQRNFEFPVNRFVSLWVFWIAVALVLGISHYIEGYPLSTFGLARGKKTLRERLIEWILAVVSAVVIAAGVIGFSRFMQNQFAIDPPSAVDTTMILPAWVLIPAWITGWFTEEVLFRGYAIERLALMLSGRRWLAGLITVVAFTLLHLPTRGWFTVLVVGVPAGALITILYVWRRNLSFVMVIHAVINAPLLLYPILAPYL